MSKTADEILILVTGGTIDSDWNPSTDTVVPRQGTHIGDLLRETIKVEFPLRVKALGMLDSRDVTDEFRQKLVNAIEETAHQRILVTHGTYTMPETAIYLSNALDKSKTVVLTGSFFPPYHMLSDVGFNLGYALGALQQLTGGVYIAMHGRVFEAGKCRKDVAAARFVAV